VPRPTVALWIGDTWRATDNLSFNLGVRWDADPGATDPPHVIETVILIDNGFESGDFGYKTGIRDINNVAPRARFAMSLREDSRDVWCAMHTSVLLSSQETGAFPNTRSGCLIRGQALHRIWQMISPSIKQEPVLNLGDTAKKLRYDAGFLQVLITIAERERIRRAAEPSTAQGIVLSGVGTLS
jgi:hypothetical protein